MRHAFRVLLLCHLLVSVGVLAQQPDFDSSADPAHTSLDERASPKAAEVDQPKEGKTKGAFSTAQSTNWDASTPSSDGVDDPKTTRHNITAPPSSSSDGVDDPKTTRHNTTAPSSSSSDGVDDPKTTRHNITAPSSSSSDGVDDPTIDSKQSRASVPSSADDELVVKKEWWTALSASKTPALNKEGDGNDQGKQGKAVNTDGKGGTRRAYSGVEKVTPALYTEGVDPIGDSDYTFFSYYVSLAVFLLLLFVLLLSLFCFRGAPFRGKSRRHLSREAPHESGKSSQPGHYVVMVDPQRTESSSTRYGKLKD